MFIIVSVITISQKPIITCISCCITSYLLSGYIDRLKKVRIVELVIPLINTTYICKKKINT